VGARKDISSRRGLILDFFRQTEADEAYAEKEVATSRKSKVQSTVRKEKMKKSQTATIDKDEKEAKIKKVSTNTVPIFPTEDEIMETAVIPKNVKTVKEEQNPGDQKMAKRKSGTTREIETFTPEEVKKPRRGYKICPECGGEVAARSRECACGYAFALKTPKKALQTGGLRQQLESRLEEIDQLLTNVEKMQEEREKIQELLDTMFEPED